MKLGLKMWDNFKNYPKHDLKTTQEYLMTRYKSDNI